MISRRHVPRAVQHLRRVFVAAIFAGTCLSAAVASGSASSDVDALIEQGIKLRVQGKNSEALEIFKRAHALAPSARTLAQVGLAEGALRLWIEGEDHLVAALASHDTPWIESARNREALEQALTSIRSHIGHVAVNGPAGAELIVNGKVACRLPLPEPLRLAEGSARIEAKAPGRRAADARIDVIGGSIRSVTLDLPPVAPPSAPTPTSAPTVLGTSEKPLRGARWKAWTGASLLAVSAAAIATGIVWLAVNGDPTCSSPSGTVCQHVYDTKTQGWIAISAGVAAAAGGGLLLWQSRDRQATVGLGPASFTIAAQF